jgi:hypothetical protein
MKKRIFTLLTIALLATISASAQNEAATIDSLQHRIAKLEKRSATWDKIKQHFKISGFIQAAYFGDFVNDKTDASHFRLRRARLSLAGKIAESKKAGIADYRLQVDFAESPKIVDLWVRYRPLEQIGIQVGQFKIPLSIENSEYNPLKLEFIDYSLVVQRLARMSSHDVTGISSAGRDMGAQLIGSFGKKEGYSVISYNLAIFNGCGINQKKDNNTSKDFVGRVMVNPIKDLALAGYYQYGEGNFNGLSGIENGKFVKYQRYGGGVAYNGKHAFARSEYIRGNTGVLTSEGAYAQAGWKFSTTKAGYGSLGVRFDYFDDNILDKQREFNYTIGAAYQPWRYMRLQLNYTIKQYQHYNQPLKHCLSVMVSGIF